MSDDDDDDANVKPAPTTSGGRAGLPALTIGERVWERAAPSPS